MTGNWTFNLWCVAKRLLWKKEVVPVWDFGRKERRMQLRTPSAVAAGRSRHEHEVRIALGYKPALWTLLGKPETWWGISWNAENKPVVLLALVNGFMSGYISFYNLQLKIQISAWVNSLTLLFVCFLNLKKVQRQTQKAPRMNHSSLKSSSGAHKQEAEDLTTGVQHLSKQTKFYLKSWGSNKMLNSVKIYYLHSLLVFFYWLLWWSHTENTRKWINAMSVKKKNVGEASPRIKICWKLWGSNIYRGTSLL